MKTPREILLQRHQPANAKLDTVRQMAVAAAVAAVCDRRTGTATAPNRRSQTAATMTLRALWRELIWPNRRTWAGLAAVWVLILVANHNLHVGGPSMDATSSPVSAGFMMSYREQELALAELTECPKPKAIEPRKRYVPQPRSDRRTEMKA